MRSMRGNIFMNQVDLKVKLYADSNGNDILSFGFENGAGEVYLNMDNCQSQMKDVYSKLIRFSIENDVSLKFETESSYKRALYKEVCEEYVKELQKELDTVIGRIRREFEE